MWGKWSLAFWMSKSRDAKILGLEKGRDTVQQSLGLSFLTGDGAGRTGRPGGWWCRACPSLYLLPHTPELLCSRLAPLLSSLFLLFFSSLSLPSCPQPFRLPPHSPSLCLLYFFLNPCPSISHLLLHPPVLFHPLTPPQTHLPEFKLPILPSCSPCPSEEQSSSHTLQGVQCHHDAPSSLLEAGWVQPELCHLLAQASGSVPKAGSCPSKPRAWLQTRQWLPEVRLGIAASCQL